MNSPSPLTRRQFNKFALNGALITSLLPFGQALKAQTERGIRGQVAPELAIDYWIDGQGNQAKPFSVEANRGRWIYLKCFQEWCPACHSVGFPNLQKLLTVFPNSKKLVAAVVQTTFEGHSVNTVDALRKNQVRYELPLPFGHDPGNTELSSADPGHFPSTMLSYRTGGTPWLTLINPEGLVVYDGFSVQIDKLIEYLKEQKV